MSSEQLKSAAKAPLGKKVPAEVPSVGIVDTIKKSVLEVQESIVKDYKKSVNMKIKMIDAWCVYCIVTCFVQILYRMMVGTYPFNSFLAGVFCHIAMAALGVSLRYTITNNNEKDFQAVSLERAVADFVFCHMVLFFIVFSFMG